MPRSNYSLENLSSLQSNLNCSPDRCHSCTCKNIQFDWTSGKRREDYNQPLSRLVMNFWYNTYQWTSNWIRIWHGTGYYVFLYPNNKKKLFHLFTMELLVHKPTYIRRKKYLTSEGAEGETSGWPLDSACGFAADRSLNPKRTDRKDKANGRREFSKWHVSMITMTARVYP